MDDLDKSLTLLIQVCRNLGMPFVGLLRPGTDRATLLKLIEGLDIELPEELIEFYEFCDGVDANGLTDDESGVYYGYSFVPLSQAIDEYRELQLEIVTEGWDDISPAWFPWLRTDSCFYFVDCDNAKTGEPYIVSYTFESGPQTAYQSIRTTVDTFADYYRQGAFIVEDGKVMSSNHEMLKQIDRLHNPEVKIDN